MHIPYCEHMASIVKHGDKWRAYVVTPAGKRRSKVCAKRADAVRWARNLEQSIDQGTYNPASARAVTVEQIAHRWLASQVWRPTTQEFQQSIVKNWVLPTFGHRKIQTIVWSDVKAWVSEMNDSDLAASSVVARYRTFVSILGLAVADQIIRQNPATIQRITLPKRQDEGVGSLEVLTVEEVSNLVSVLPSPLRCFALVGVGAGLRPGEIAGLKVGDLDLGAGVGMIRVRTQVVTTVRDGSNLSGLKTPKSLRDVPIPDELVEALSSHLSEHPAVLWAGERMVFSNRYGKFWRRSTLGDAWRKAATGAGINPKARGWHALRHFYASSLIAAGESVTTVQARLGHATAVETLNTYAHLWPENENVTRSAMSDMFKDLEG